MSPTSTSRPPIPDGWMERHQVPDDVRQAFRDVVLLPSPDGPQGIPLPCTRRLHVFLPGRSLSEQQTWQVERFGHGNGPDGLSEMVLLYRRVG